MLTDEQIDVYYALIQDRIDKVNDKYLQEIGEQIAAIGELNPSSVRKLAQMRKFGANSEKMRRELSRVLKKSQADIEALYQKAIDDEYADAAYALTEIGKDIPDPKENKELTRYLEAVSRQTEETFQNFSNTTVISESYQQIISDGVDAVSRGVSDYKSVIRRSIKANGGDGLKVTYESGLHRRLDTAIRQNILDSTKQISMKCAEMIGEEIGADGVELSAHPYSALDHEPCQGRQYTKANYELMQSGQSFQDVDGNFYEGFRRPITQWNCRHFASPILIGISPRRYTDKQLEEWRKANHKGCEINGKKYTIYQASQLMRNLEAEVRRQKDIANLCKASGDDVGRRNAQWEISKCKAQYKAVSEACNLKQRPEKMVVNSYKDVSDDFTKAESRGIINTRNMALGMRKPASKILTNSEIEEIKKEASDLGINSSLLRFNSGSRTGFDDIDEIINIRGDIFPDLESGSKIPRDLMSSKAVLAHEYYGHYLHNPTKLDIGDWRDEFRASYCAAVNAPNLSDEDRMYLMLDAYDRAKEAGVSVKYNKIARRIVYGYHD